jgi:hypothetical protein
MSFMLLLSRKDNLFIAVCKEDGVYYNFFN